jgi:biotin carboxyl carrier protein
MARPTRYLVKDLLASSHEAQPVDVEDLGGERYLVTVDGQRLEVDAYALEGAALALRIGAASYAVELEEKGDQFGVRVKGQVNRFDVVDERTSRARPSSAGLDATGKQLIVSPMPGKVVKVFIAVGDAVKAGDPLVVIEAMKMENELKAARAGVVTEVLTREGATVENGARLVVVE